jgi:chorismate synthase
MLTTILEGIPANLPLAAEEINLDLARRQRGYGRGGRMRIEKDEANIVGGVRHGLTMGGPIAILIANRDWENWKLTMDPRPGGREADSKEPVTRPRPGHADLAGALKYSQHDIRNVLERASARETAARVAVGAVCKRLLREFDIEVSSHVVAIGGIEAKTDNLSFAEIRERAEASEVRCADPEAGEAMMRKIDEARKRGTTLGGVFEVWAFNLPVGLGSYVHWDRKLDGRLAQAVMSIQAIKGVEIGLGFEGARRFGFETHDEIFYEDGRGGPRGRAAPRGGGGGGGQGDRGADRRAAGDEADLHAVRPVGLSGPPHKRAV